MLRNKLFTLWLLLWASALTACVRGATADVSRELEAVYMGNTPQIDTAYAKGVSGHFAFLYTAGDTTYLVMGGGCNFPEASPSNGGKKRYYSAIYAAPLMEKEGIGEWREIGHISTPTAYAAMDYRDGVCSLYGGETSSGDTKRVYSFSLRKDVPRIADGGNTHLSIDSWGGDFFGEPRSGMAYVRLDSLNYYFIGGRSNGMLIDEVLQHSDTSDCKLAMPYPGGARLKVVAWSGADNIYMVGSCSGLEGRDFATLSLNAYCYSPKGKEWSEIALPKELGGATFGGGQAVSMSDGTTLLVGGVHADKFLPAIQRSQQITWAKEAGDTELLNSLTAEQNTYLERPIDWYAFNHRAWQFDPHTESWSLWGEHPELARADAVYLPYKGGLLVVGGETKPGVRSNKIYHIKPSNK